MKKIFLLFLLIFCISLTCFGSERENVSNISDHISFKTIDQSYLYNKLNITSPMSRRSDALLKRSMYVFLYVAIGFTVTLFVSLFSSILITILYALNYSELSYYKVNSLAYNEKVKFLNGFLAGLITSWIIFGVSVICTIIFWALHNKAKRSKGRVYSEVKNNQFVIGFRF